ncbi:hypothetical protein V2J09_002330 [Rumex salicifolius]
MENRLTKVPRPPIAACMTCPLCKDLFEEATTISLCLHTFCWEFWSKESIRHYRLNLALLDKILGESYACEICKKCIHEKFSDEESDTCPICDVYLGTTPEDKLRPDNNLQALREKIFPTKRMGETSEFALSGTPPKRKEKSTLISLAVTTPKVSEGSSGQSERRSKSASKKSSSVTVVFKTSKASFNESLNEEAVSDGVPGKGELWEPLKYLSEVARGSDTAKPSSSRGISESCSAGDDEEEDDDDDAIEAESEKNVDSDQQVVVDVLRLDRANMPVWFSLVASEDEGEAARLPQLSSRFLRLKNGEMPVSYIQKYIAKKFHLTKEDEVVIKFQGEILLPSTLLWDVEDKWSTSGSGGGRSGLVKTEVGDSSEKYVMPLTYSTKLQPIGQVQVQAPLPVPPTRTLINLTRAIAQVSST